MQNEGQLNTRYARCKAAADKARQAYDRAKGRQQVALQTLRQKYDVTSPAAATKKLSALDAEADELKTELEEKLDEFESKWADQLAGG